MHTVLIAIAVSSQSFPAGTLSAGIKITLGSMEPVVVAAEPYNASFTDVPAGDYTVTAQAVDAVGNGLGDPITASVTVAPDAVQVDIPTSISVQVS